MRKPVLCSTLAVLITLLPSVTLAYSASPSPAASPMVQAAEDENVTAAAKDLYKELAAGNVDRSKLSDELNDHLSEKMLQQISTELSQLGTPEWEYQKQVESAHGKVSIYKLSYDQGALYFGVGVAKSGTIYAIKLSDTPL